MSIWKIVLENEKKGSHDDRVIDLMDLSEIAGEPILDAGYLNSLIEISSQSDKLNVVPNIKRIIDDKANNVPTTSFMLLHGVPKGETEEIGIAFGQLDTGGWHIASAYPNKFAHELKDRNYLNEVLEKFKNENNWEKITLVAPWKPHWSLILEYGEPGPKDDIIINFVTSDYVQTLTPLIPKFLYDILIQVGHWNNYQLLVKIKHITDESGEILNAGDFFALLGVLPNNIQVNLLYKVGRNDFSLVGVSPPQFLQAMQEDTSLYTKFITKFAKDPEGWSSVNLVLNMGENIYTGPEELTESEKIEFQDLASRFRLGFK